MSKRYFASLERARDWHENGWLIKTKSRFCLTDDAEFVERQKGAEFVALSDEAQCWDETDPAHPVNDEERRTRILADMAWRDFRDLVEYKRPAGATIDAIKQASILLFGDAEVEA